MARSFSADIYAGIMASGALALRLQPRYTAYCSNGITADIYASHGKRSRAFASLREASVFQDTNKHAGK